MWKPDIDKMQRQDESERLEQAEDNNQALKFGYFYFYFIKEWYKCYGK